MSMSCPHVYYSTTIHLSQGQHAMSMYPDVILFNLCYTCIHHVYTVVATTYHNDEWWHKWVNLKVDIMWEVHKRTWQGVSAKLESYIYRVHMVHTTSSYLPHFLLKTIILYIYALMSSSRFFYYVLGLWPHIMWHIMQLWCHVPSSSFKRKRKEKKNKINIKSEK